MNVFVPPRNYQNKLIRRGGWKGSSPAWTGLKLLIAGIEEEKEDSDCTKQAHVCVDEDTKGICFFLLRCMTNPTCSSNTTEPLKFFLGHSTSEIGEAQQRKQAEKRGIVDDAPFAAGADWKKAKRSNGNGSMSKFVSTSPKV